MELGFQVGRGEGEGVCVLAFALTYFASSFSKGIRTYDMLSLQIGLSFPQI